MQEKELLSNISKSFKDLCEFFEKLAGEDKKEKKISFEEVRGILAEKSRAGFTSQVKELLNKYGANKLSDIDESKYEELVNDARKLNA